MRIVENVAAKTIRVDGEVLRMIEAVQRPRETYNTALRRLLKLGDPERREDGRRERRRAS